MTDTSPKPQAHFLEEGQSKEVNKTTNKVKHPKTTEDRDSGDVGVGVGSISDHRRKISTGGLSESIP